MATNTSTGLLRAKDTPAFGAFAVTPSDAADLPRPVKGLYIGTSGDLKVTMIDGSTVSFAGIPVGILPIAVKKVFATGQVGTIASNIVGLY